MVSALIGFPFVVVGVLDNTIRRLCECGYLEWGLLRGSESSWGRVEAAMMVVYRQVVHKDLELRV